MTIIREPVPDLLRRFAPTPHVAEVTIGVFSLTVQTDDRRIIAAMQQTSVAEDKSSSLNSIMVRVVRDDVPMGDAKVLLISAPPLITLIVGTGTTLTLDCERREMLGFLSRSISAERFSGELLPLLLGRFRSEIPEPLDQATKQP